jgi:threonine dehydrogenase-like Zn-dependent dehydrogenase
MFAVAVIEPGRVELVDIPKPVPGPYDVIVKTELAYLCNATDMKLIEGHFPGITQYPLLLGHESTGIVEAVGEKVSTYKPGDRTILAQLFEPPEPKYSLGWGGFSEYTVVRDHHAMVKDGVADAQHGWLEVYQRQPLIPDDIPAEEAAMLCTWLEVHSSFHDFHLQAGDDILVFGGGPVGLSFIKFTKKLGLGYVGIVDSHPEKLQKAMEMRADETFERDDPRLSTLTETRGKPFDAIIDAVGKESIINTGLPLIKLGGSICVYGVIDSPSIQLHKHRGPYNFNLLIHQWPTAEWVAAAVEPVCQWIREGTLSAEEFLSGEFPIADITKAIDLIKARLAIKVLLRF